MRLPRVRNFSLIFVFILIFLSIPLLAQKGGGGGKGGGGSAGSTNINPNTVPESEWTVYNIPKTAFGEEGLQGGPPPCFRWPVSGTVSAKVNTQQLLVSDNAYKEFQEACSDVKGKKLPKAQEHLQKAIRIDPKYAVAWALLGQVETDQQNPAEATKSCQHAMDIDASYLPPYLCLADIAARATKWDEVATLTSKVIDFHPVKAPGAYYFNSLANLNLNHLPEAEKSGLEALKEGGPDQQLQSRLLLAKIYEAQGDRASEAEQLREYLKLKPQPNQAEVAKKVLQQIEEGQTDKK